MASQTVSFVSAEDYLYAERKAAWKSEYYDGQVYKMAGARPRHTRIAANLTGRLPLDLEGSPCQGFNSDMRVHIPATGLSLHVPRRFCCLSRARSVR
jgi:Uma2 family endonuclease